MSSRNAALRKSVYLVVQEGGSSTELYLHVLPSLRTAESYRRSCAKGAYRTSSPVEVAAALVGAPGFIPAVEAVLTATLTIEYPSRAAGRATR